MPLSQHTHDAPSLFQRSDRLYPCPRHLHAGMCRTVQKHLVLLSSIHPKARVHQARLRARSQDGQGCPSHFPCQLHPCRSRASAVRTTLVANTTKRAQFLHSVQNAEASPLSLLALCLPVLTLVFPPLSHWQAASLTYCSLFMLLLSLPSLLFESA